MTPKEKEVIEYCLTNDYLDGEHPVEFPCWWIDGNDVSFPANQLSGVVSSCVKKGWVVVDGKGQDKTMKLTQKGWDDYHKKI